MVGYIYIRRAKYAPRLYACDETRLSKEDVAVAGDPEKVLVLYCGPSELQMHTTWGSQEVIERSWWQSLKACGDMRNVTQMTSNDCVIEDQNASFCHGSAVRSGAGSL